MTNAQAAIIGGLLAAAIVAHAVIGRSLEGGATAAAGATATDLGRQDSARDAEILRIRIRAEETKALLEVGRPFELKVGDRSLLVSTDWKQEGGDFSYSRRFYESKDGRWVLVELPRSSGGNE